jgi:hypothetical protein
LGTTYKIINVRDLPSDRTNRDQAISQMLAKGE